MNYNDFEQFKKAYYEKLEKDFDEVLRENYNHLLEAEKEKNENAIIFRRKQNAEIYKAHEKQKRKAKEFFEQASFTSDIHIITNII